VGSPCLFHDPGVHPLAPKLRTDDPCGLTFTSASNPDWGRVQSDFDDVWACHVPQFSSALSARGKVVFADEDLKVFRMAR